jgi:hypothetical protein
VLAFRKSIPEEGLCWPYNGQAEFLKYANDHLRKFLREDIARNTAGKSNPEPVKANRKATPVPHPEDRFTLKVGKKGTVTFPPLLLKLLGMQSAIYSS